MNCEKCQTPIQPKDGGTLCGYCEADIRNKMRRQHSALLRDPLFLHAYHNDPTVSAMIHQGEPLEKIVIVLAAEKATLLQNLITQARTAPIFLHITKDPAAPLENRKSSIVNPPDDPPTHAANVADPSPKHTFGNKQFETQPKT